MRGSASFVATSEETKSLICERGSRGAEAALMSIRRIALMTAALVTAACSADRDEEVTASSSDALSSRSALSPMINLAGFAQTATPTGTIDTTNPFFQSLGTNGRTCNSCHEAETGWTITPERLQLRFLVTGGKDPIFLALDGSDSPASAPANLSEKWEASKNLLTRGTIRVGLPKSRPTPTWDIDVEIVADPRNTNSLTPTNGQISFFRRPLPTTNLRFLAAVNWDGRNTPDQTNMRPGLLAQANGATTGHAQGAPLSDATRAQIVDFETSLTTAQVRGWDAGALEVGGAVGGPDALLTQTFAINETSGRQVFSLYDAWSVDPSSDRQKIANGQRIFNERTFGPNNERTCSGCHGAANVGGGARFAFFDVGISDAARWNHDVPLYRVTQRSNPSNVIETTDPGRAMITGQFADVNKFKVPGLRGLAARAPYFHDGSARSLDDVVRHYDEHFGIGLDGDDRNDLVAFLESL
jgi:hypothetical protein